MASLQGDFYHQKQKEVCRCENRLTSMLGYNIYVMLHKNSSAEWQEHCCGASFMFCLSRLQASYFLTASIKTLNYFQIKLLIDGLTAWDILKMNDTIPIEKAEWHHHHIWMTLMCFFWSWQQFSHTLWWLYFYSDIITLHLCLITCYDVLQKATTLIW